MSEKIQAQIQAAEKRLAQLRAKQAAALRRQQSKEKAAQRAHDARRKVLLGVVVQHAADAGLLSPEDLRVWCDLALTRDADREVFGLPLQHGGAHHGQAN